MTLIRGSLTAANGGVIGVLIVWISRTFQLKTHDGAVPRGARRQLASHAASATRQVEPALPVDIPTRQVAPVPPADIAVRHIATRSNPRLESAGGGNSAGSC